MHKRPANRDLAQVVLLRRSWHRYLAQEILIHRSCTSGSTGFCWGDLQHLVQEILIQRSCTRGPTGCWCRHPDREILHKRSADRDLAQVLLRILGDLDTDILHKRPHTPILHKCSYRILGDLDTDILHKRSSYTDLAQVVLQDPAEQIYRDFAQVVLLRRSWHRHLAQEIVIHRSCTSASTGFCWGDLQHLAQEVRIQISRTRGPTGSWRRHPDREILHKRSSYRDFAQEVLQDPDADIMTERSCTRDPQTEVLHKCSYRIRGDLDTDILHKRSSYTDLAQVLLQDSAEEIFNTLRKRSSYRHLAQEVLQDLDAKILTQRSCARGPHTEILHKIPMQRSWHRDMHKRSADRDLAQVALLRRSWQRHLTQKNLIHRSGTSASTGFCWGDLQHLAQEILIQRSCTSSLTEEILT